MYGSGWYCNTLKDKASLNLTTIWTVIITYFGTWTCTNLNMWPFIVILYIQFWIKYISKVLQSYLLSVCMCKRKRIIHKHRHMYVNMYIYIYIYAPMNVCVDIYIYIYIYTHTHIYMFQAKSVCKNSTEIWTIFLTNIKN